MAVVVAVAVAVAVAAVESQAFAEGSRILVVVNPDQSQASNLNFKSDCCFEAGSDLSQLLEGSSFAVAVAMEPSFVGLDCFGLELKVAVAVPMVLDPCC